MAWRRQRGLSGQGDGSADGPPGSVWELVERDGSATTLPRCRPQRRAGRSLLPPLATATAGSRTGTEQKGQQQASAAPAAQPRFASMTAVALGAPSAAPSNSKCSVVGLLAVPAGVMEGSHQKQYAWDERQGRLRALEAEDWEAGEEAARTLRGRVRRAAHDLRSSFFPQPEEVSPDYWDYVKYRAFHRFFSSMSTIFATQSLLQAVGVGAKRSLPAAATINWVLKDGLGRLGRLTVATRFGESFDSDLKRFRYTTSIIYAVSLSLEFLTPLAPQHFLVMASLANVGKSIGLTTFIATQPAFHRSFCLRENMADISAKTQAQQMVIDNMGLATAVGLNYLCRHTEATRRALPLAMFPLLAVGDLWAIYSELRSIHLRTLNKERAEIIAQHWLQQGRVPTPRQVSQEERFVLPPHIEVGRMPLTICSLDRAVLSKDDLQLLEQQGRDDRFFLTFNPPDEPGSTSGSSSSSNSNNSRLDAPRWRRFWRGADGAGSVRICLRQDAVEQDIVQAVLQAAHLRQLLGVPPACSKQLAAAAASAAAAAAASPAAASPASAAVPEAAPGSFGSSSSSGGSSGGSEGLDLQAAVAESASRAQSSLKPFLSELREQGWQLTPFMLSSTEKQRYLRL